MGIRKWNGTGRQYSRLFRKSAVLVNCHKNVKVYQIGMYFTFKTLGFFFFLAFFFILKKDTCSSKETEFAITCIYKSTHIPHFLTFEEQGNVGFIM